MAGGGFAAAAALLLAFAGAPSAMSDSGWRPERPMIDALETAVVMPPGARPLAEYRRQYGGMLEAGRRVIWGVFHVPGIPGLPKDELPVAIFDREPPPMIQDGGCSVVTLKFDVSAQRVLWIQCNGEA